MNPRPLTFVAVLTAVSLGASAPALAESAEATSFLVLESRGGVAEGDSLGKELAAWLRSAGRGLVDPAGARTVFLRNHSRDAAQVSVERVRKFILEGENALLAHDRNDSEGFARHLVEAEKLLDGAGEVFGRENTQAVYDLCVAAVRHALQKPSGQAAALRKARECDARFPGYSPEYTLAPEIVAMLEQARKDRVAEGIGSLMVTSTPSHCTVFINGNEMSATPFTQPHPPPGERLVQVECSGSSSPGRVHTVLMGKAPVALHVDVDFDEAVVSRDPGGIALAYVGVPDAARVRGHARTVSAAVGTEDVLLVRMQSDTELAIDWIRGEWVSSVTLPVLYTPSQLDAGLRGLLHAEPAAGKASPATDAPPIIERRAWRLGLGLSSLAAGVGLTAAGWAAYRAHVADGVTVRQNPSVTEPGYIDRLQTWVDGRAMPYALVGVGVLPASFGLDWLVYADLDSLWYVSMSSGLAGAALASAGAVLIAQGGACPSNHQPTRAHCITRQERRDKGALLVLTSSTLLQLPALHLSKWAAHRLSADPVVSVGVSPSSVGFTASGTF